MVTIKEGETDWLPAWTVGWLGDMTESDCTGRVSGMLGTNVVYCICVDPETCSSLSKVGIFLSTVVDNTDNNNTIFKSSGWLSGRGMRELLI